MSEQQMDDDQIVNVGQMAANALSNPIFRIEYDHLTMKYFNQWRAASEAHTKEMSFLKAKHMVLDEIMRDLTSMVGHAEKIYAERQQQNSPEAQESRRLDGQGFGLDYGQGGAA